MTHLLIACRSILDQLEGVLRQIEEGDFSRPSNALSKASIGQHLRHTIEFFFCLETGLESGLLSYDKREHDQLIEADKQLAMLALQQIRRFVERNHSDRGLKLEVAYEKGNENSVTIDTNYRRELVYNIEHAVHHMAIMKIGIREVAPYIQLPSDFGIAVSTLRFRETQAVNVG